QGGVHRSDFLGRADAELLAGAAEREPAVGRGKESQLPAADPWNRHGSRRQGAGPHTNRTRGRIDCDRRQDGAQEDERALAGGPWRQNHRPPVERKQESSQKHTGEKGQNRKHGRAARKTVSTMARLIISSPDGKNGILELTKPVTTIGRGNANDLVLNDSSISRFHAVIKLKDDAIFVADRGSTNGIILNDQRISQETELRNGDTALVGRYRLRLEDVDDKGLQVRRGQWPSTLNQIIRGHSDRASLARGTGVSSSALTDLAGRVKKLERENYLLTVLYEAGKALNSKLALEHICEQVVSLACLIEGVERGFVMLFDEAGEVVRQSEVRYRDPQIAESRLSTPARANPERSGDPGAQIILSKSVLELIRTERQPILIEDVSSDERFSGSESMKISG